MAWRKVEFHDTRLLDGSEPRWRQALPHYMAHATEVLIRRTCCGELGADDLECISDLLVRRLAEDDHIVQDIQDGQHSACIGT